MSGGVAEKLHVLAPDCSPGQQSRAYLFLSAVQTVPDLDAPRFDVFITYYHVLSLLFQSRKPRRNMADPLSISAAVVQFLQISGHLCLKLHSFCADMEDVPKRLGSLESDLQQQIMVAKDIQGLVAGASSTLNSTSTDSLRAILDDYSSKMEHLLRIINSVSSESHDGFLKRSWNALRALDKKNAMLLCCDQLAQKRSLLSIWLGKANMDISHQVKDIAKESRDQSILLSRQVEANSAKIDAHQGELSRSIRATEIISNEVRVLATQQDNGHQDILAAVHETGSEIRSLADDWQSIGTTLHEFRNILQSNQELSRVILQVASTRNASSTGLEQYDSGDIFEMIQQVHLQNVQNDSPTSKGTGVISSSSCTCRAFSQLTYREPLSMLHLKSVFRKRHYSSCPKFKSSDESLEYTIKVIPPTWLLSHTINLSLVLRNWSNGRGFSIAPVVIGTSRIVDRNTSPGFRTVQTYEEFLETRHFENSTEFVDSLERSLRDVLSAGQSSPLDEDRDGNTLLYDVIRLYLRHQRCGLSNWATKAPGFLSLVQLLLDNGANPNAICAHNTSYLGASQGTALDLFACELVPKLMNLVGEEEIGRALIEKLTKEGAEFSRPPQTVAKKHPAYFSQHFKVEIEELQLFPEQVEVCGYNDLVPAILERDEARLRKALTSCDSNYQSAYTGLSAAHFAVTWPVALTALVEMGVDVNVEDHFHRRPIHLATALGEPEAVKILLEEDCAVWTYNDSLSLLQEALQGLIEENRERIANSVITAYIDRYTRFFDLARSMLPQFSPTLAELTSGLLLERLVPRVQQELERRHCHIPPALELDTDGTRVYETADLHACTRLTVEMAERLWDGGFRQIHEHFDRGTTPLLESWYNADFEMIKWLISKGASPFSRHEQTQGSGLHLFAHRLGYPGAYFNHDISAVYCRESIVSQLESDLDSRRDSCRCLCSVGGCTPVVIFLRSNFDLRRFKWGDFSGSAYEHYLTQLHLFWEKLPPVSGEEHVSMEAVLRLLVFENMGLKHQCCRLGQMAEDYRAWKPVTDESPPESECEIEAMLSQLRDKMRNCECQLLEKPLCVVFREDCKSL